MPRRRLRARQPFTAAAVALALTAGVPAPMPLLAQSAAAPMTLEAATARAIATNPAVIAARRRAPIATAALGVAAERLNPEFHLELERETPKEAYGVAVPLELGGKRARRMAVSEAAIHTGEAELDLAILDVRVAVRRAYFARAVAEARLALLGELRDLAVRVRDAARDRFQAGSAPRLEVVQAELALSQVENEIAAARAESTAALTSFNALLGAPLDAPVTLSTSLDSGTVPDPETAVGQALAASGDLAVLQRQIDEQTARVALARAQQTPDVIPEATLTRNAAPEFDTGWRAAVTVTLPVFTTHRAGIRLEEATLAQLQSEQEAARARISASVAAAATLARSQRDQYVRYRDEILPQAEQVEQMAEDAYTLGQTGIAAFLQALQSTRDVRLRSLQAAADFQNTMADLERAIGVPAR